MFLGKGVFFSELKKVDIFDKEDKKIGRIGDLLLKKDTFVLDSLILHGSFIEEKLEDFGLRDDRDPIVPVQLIKNHKIISNRLSLSESEQELECTFTGWEPPEDLIQLTKLKKVDVVDSDEKLIGKVTDFIFHSDGNHSFVLGDYKFLHKLDRYHLLHNDEAIIPEKYFEELNYTKIKLSLKQENLTRRNLLSLKRLFTRDYSSMEIGVEEVATRYKYFVYEVDRKDAIQNLNFKRGKSKLSKQQLKIQKLDISNKDSVSDFVNTFNEVAMTSVDPYEEMTMATAKEYFGDGSYIGYRFNKPIGYCVTSVKESENGKIGAIAGVGIASQARGKGLATLFLDYTFREVFSDDVRTIQCDILSSNEASQGLFTKLGFKKIDEFYLY